MPTMRDSTASNLQNSVPSEQEKEALYRIFKFQSNAKSLTDYLKQMKEMKKNIEEVNQSIDKIK